MAGERPGPEVFPKVSYEWFASAASRDGQVPVGFVPLERVFGTSVRFSPGRKIHDVAAGTGRSLQYILTKVPPEIVRTLQLVASEPSTENHEVLRRRAGLSVEIVEKDAVPAIAEVKDCDLIFFINAIHLLGDEDKVAAISAAYDSLSPGGLFVVSSTFIEEGIPKGEDFFTKWAFNTFRALGEFGEDRGAVIKRLRENKLGFWPAEQYRQAFEEAGFGVDMEMATMPCTLESIEGICHYSVWNGNTIPGVEAQKAMDISLLGLHRTWEQMGKSADSIVNRNTMVIVGRKPQLSAPFLERVEEIRGLETDGDEEFRPVSGATVERVLAIAAACIKFGEPQISPALAGSIRLDWVLGNDKVVGFYVDEDGEWPNASLKRTDGSFESVEIEGIESLRALLASASQ